MYDGKALTRAIRSLRCAHNWMASSVIIAIIAIKKSTFDRPQKIESSPPPREIPHGPQNIFFIMRYITEKEDWIPR